MCSAEDAERCLPPSRRTRIPSCRPVGGTPPGEAAPNLAAAEAAPVTDGATNALAGAPVETAAATITKDAASRVIVPRRLQTIEKGSACCAKVFGALSWKRSAGFLLK